LWANLKKYNPQIGFIDCLRMFGMKVLYDHQSFTGMTYGGVSRYFVELMRSFQQRSDVCFELSLKFSNNEYLERTSFSHHYPYKRFAHNRKANLLASLCNRMYSIQRLRAGQFDVFHPTYYHRYFLRWLGKKPMVLTFHDATSERYGSIYPEVGEHLYEIKKALLPQADRIIAVSEYTKSDILRYFDVPAEKIEVIHLGTPFTSRMPEPQPVSVPGPYLLYVGKRPLYKNFTGLLNALPPIMARHPDLQLVCAGGGALTTEERAAIQAVGLADRVHYFSITDGVLCYLYQRAEAFIFPSLNEGFGIPVLEAFSCGCPVILSDRSSLPEVGADAAVYFDPEQPESIQQAIEQVLGSESLRAQMRARGTERLALFSCEKTAQQTLDVYQQLI